MHGALIFDLDGTLVESLPGIAASLNRTLQVHGLPSHPESSVRGFIGDGARMLVTRALSPASLDLHLESVLRGFSEDYSASWQHGTHPYPNISKLLTDLQSQNIPLAVLSNKPHPFTIEIVANLFPDISFAAVLGNRQDLPHKPDPTGALEIANSLGIAPEKCVIIGDSTMDLETARRAGMKSIAVTWGYHDRVRLSAADNIAEDITQLASLLEFTEPCMEGLIENPPQPMK